MESYTIFGERNSGTNYLKKVMNDNFSLSFTHDFGFKHWYIRDLEPRGRANQTTDNECIKTLEEGKNTLFLFIVRNPFDWVGSMFSKPYHFPEANKKSMSSFLRQKYQCYETDLPKNHANFDESPWALDPVTGTYFIEESENIVALRNEKNEHFYALSKQVDNFFLIKQETLKEDLLEMQQKFDLPAKNGLVELQQYRKPKQNKNLTGKDKEFIINNLNNKVDNKYYLPEII